jgi:hypothetical protein
MRRLPTVDDRVMERARISSNDMMQAVAFIDVALKLEEGGADSKSDVTHLALVVAAVIYYARPFGPNKAGPRRAIWCGVGNQKRWGVCDDRFRERNSIG